VDVPPTRYARSGDVNIAYQVSGEGPFDVVFVPPFVSHVELLWRVPSWAAFNRRLASSCRLILFDKRGTGMSDRISGATSLEAPSTLSARGRSSSAGRFCDASGHPTSRGQRRRTS
jgi:pimeloyl-ACP methyl ester carboxylesterase